MKQNGKVLVLIFILISVFISADSYGEDFKMYMVYSPKTNQARFIVYDSDKTKEKDVDMYLTFFKGGSTKLAWAAAKLHNIEVLTLDKMSEILIKKGCVTEDCIDKAIDNIPMR